MCRVGSIPSLYVHIPFCLKKCDYCAFYSVNWYESVSLCYLLGMELEIPARLPEAPEGVFSLFLGGGTPTALPNMDLDRLLNLIHTHFTFTAPPDRKDAAYSIEKTSEANPGTLDTEKLKTLTHYQINRISLGAQSFNDKLLQAIGRIHSAADIQSSVGIIRKAGITNLNLDLMFGLPGQTMADWQDTVKQAVVLEPEHLSVYGLTLEEGTPLQQRFSVVESESGCIRQTDLPDDDLQADMAEWTAEYLYKHGYGHYEISNYAKPGYECRHNLAYWDGRDYIGLGPGAVSCSNAVRKQNVADVKRYTSLLRSGQSPYDHSETEQLTRNQQISEYVMLKLRTAAGIDLEEFEQRFNDSFQDIYGHILANYMDRNVLIMEARTIRLSPRYFFVANAVMREFMI